MTWLMSPRNYQLTYQSSVADSAASEKWSGALLSTSCTGSLSPGATLYDLSVCSCLIRTGYSKLLMTMYRGAIVMTLVNLY